MAKQIRAHLPPQQKSKWDRLVNNTQYYANKAWNFTSNAAFGAFNALTSKELTDWMGENVWTPLGGFIAGAVPSAILAWYTKHNPNAQIHDNYPSQFNFDSSITN